MKKLIIAAFISLTLVACTKKSGLVYEEGLKSYNLLRITGGDFKGYTFKYSPSQGFYAEALPNEYFFHLVFGDDDKDTYTGSDIMSVVFYYSGDLTYHFPSKLGIEIQLGIIVEDTVQMFKEKDVVLTLEKKPSKTELIGMISGDFVHQWDSTRVIQAEMDIRIPLMEAR